MKSAQVVVFLALAAAGLFWFGDGAPSAAEQVGEPRAVAVVAADCPDGVCPVGAYFESPAANDCDSCPLAANNGVDIVSSLVVEPAIFPSGITYRRQTVYRGPVRRPIFRRGVVRRWWARRRARRAGF